MKRSEDEKLVLDDDRGVYSPWISPVGLVKEKDGSTRFCVDFRKFNSDTKKVSYLLSQIDGTLATLSGAKWFSTLDLKAGHWQVGIHQSDKEKQRFHQEDAYDTSMSYHSVSALQHLSVP